MFGVTEVQRHSDTTSFEQYAAVRELRSAATEMALAFGEASAHGVEASAEIEEAERTLASAIASVESSTMRRDREEKALVTRQTRAALGLAELANAATREPAGRAVSRELERAESRRDRELERFSSANDKLLERLAAARSEARQDAARRPVFLVLALFALFGFFHTVFIERPASRDRKRRQAQADFADAMQVARSEAEAYDLVSRHVERVPNVARVTVLNRNNSADRLEPVTPVETGTALAQGLQGARPDSCLSVRLARTHERTSRDEPLLACDICGRSPEDTTCVPSLVGGEVIGAVLAEHRGPLGHREREVVEHSVSEAAPVVANLRNLAVAELRASTDALTGLANQRTVHETLKRAAAQAGRDAGSLALVLFDLDHFKAINDTYGHGKGDEVLAAIGAAASGTLRASDFVGRFGGEEFAVILPGGNRAGGLEAAEKIRVAISTTSVPGVGRQVTASFGVAVLPDDAGEPDLLMRLADRALYAAKSAGRDCVRTVDPSPSVILTPDGASAQTLEAIAPLAQFE
ncbi:MAG TPA: GGDEF domain-containing protein [Thermoleophilaceae bacterium]|nr:GGDEF domain-containing protein [Thermoleophilaceae bacterium]